MRSIIKISLLLLFVVTVIYFSYQIGYEKGRKSIFIENTNKNYIFVDRQE